MAFLLSFFCSISRWPSSHYKRPAMFCIESTLMNVNWLRILSPFVSSNPKLVKVPHRKERDLHSYKFFVAFQLIPLNESTSGGCSVHSPVKWSSFLSINGIDSLIKKSFAWNMLRV